MKITNRAGLPDGLVRAIENDPYDSGDSDITASTLADPPLLQALKRAHWNELEEDASERVWALLGQAAHVIAERGADKTEGILYEKRLFMDVLGWKVSGAMDHFTIAKGVLSDLKITSAWTLVYKDRLEDWTRQLNVLAHLIDEAGGYKVTALEVIAILRDWAKRDAERSKDYPTQSVVVVPLKLWPKDKRQAYIEGRVKLHQKARELFALGHTDLIMGCTDDERWAKKDRKTGVTKYIRCEGYCPVKNVCPVLSREKDEREKAAS